MAARQATEQAGMQRRAQAVQPVLVALDTTDSVQAAGLANALRGHVGGLKLGLEFFMANGAAGVARISELGQPVFLDLKFHDIPNTVAGAVRAVAPLQPFILNVHAGGGRAMMLAAREAALDSAAKLGVAPPKLIAVTVLTSFAGSELAEVGQPADPQDQVRRLAALTRDCGLDGVVCSAREIAVLRQDLGADFLLVTPGIRPAWAATGDQKRIMTPAEAMDAGADYLVIGRPITGADDPVEAARRIADEIAGRPGDTRTRA